MTQPYDTTEAASILRRTLLTTNKGAFEEARAKAARELHRIAQNAIDAAGFQVRNTSNHSTSPDLHRFTIDLPMRRAAVSVSADDEAGVLLDVKQQGDPVAVTQPALYFDAELGAFAVAQPPGRSPIAVIAESIERAIRALR